MQRKFHDRRPPARTTLKLRFPKFVSIFDPSLRRWKSQHTLCYSSVSGFKFTYLITYLAFRDLEAKVPQLEEKVAQLEEKVVGLEVQLIFASEESGSNESDSTQSGTPQHLQEQTSSTTDMVPLRQSTEDFNLHDEIVSVEGLPTSDRGDYFGDMEGYFVLIYM